MGANKAVVKEQLANGTWRVTIVKGLEGGLEFDPVPGAAVDASGKGGKAGRLGASPDVQAAFLSQHESGEAFTFRSEKEADRFILYRDRLPSGSPPTGPPMGGAIALDHYAETTPQWEKDAIRWANAQQPTETYTQDGTKVAGSVSAGGVGGASASAMDGLGTKIDERTGARTDYSRLAGEVAADFAPPGAQVGGKLNGEAIVGISRTRDGDVTSMTINLSGSAQSSGGLGTESPLRGVGDAKGAVAGHESAGTRIERVVTIDAVDPGNREAIERFERSGGRDPGAVADVVRRLDDEARVDIRRFETGGSSVGGNVDGKVGKLEVTHEQVDAELSSARHRTPGGDTFVTTSE
jgi:hypothetical protein